MSKIHAPGTAGPVWTCPNDYVGMVFEMPDGIAMWSVLDPEGVEIASGRADGEILGWQECNTIVKGLEQ